MIHNIFNNQLFSTLFDNACVGILAVDEKGGIRAANKYLLQEFGYCEKEVIGQTVEFLIPVQMRAHHRKLRESFSKHPISVTIPAGKKLHGLKKNGTEFPVEMSLGYYESNGTTYYVAFVNDTCKKQETDETIRHLNEALDQKIEESTRSLKETIARLNTRIKENERKEDKLLKALDREKELNQLKSRFVSVASHEFRTPLSGILASTYLLSKYTRENEQPHRDKHIKRILASVNLLNEVLGDFLSVDKMEQENFKPTFTVFDITASINEIIQNMQHMLKSGQHISFTHDKANDVTYLDQSMFNHILTNLLSNAIKYSPENTRIDVSIEHNNDTLLLKVKDHGMGIPKKEQENLYQRFFRSSNAAQIQGTGLGLNIVKKYVDVLDGTIDCNSEENRGTEFVITFKNQKKQYENSISS